MENQDKVYKFELDESIRRIIRMYYWFGIWRETDEHYLRKFVVRLLYLLQNLSFVSISLVGAYFSDDENQRIFLVQVSIVLSVMTVKLFYLLYRNEVILGFLYDPTVVHCVTDYDESLEVKDKIDKIVKFIQAYTVIAGVATVFTVIISLPIFTSDKRIPLFIKFEMDSEYETLFYWLAFLYLVTCFFFGLIYPWTIVFLWYIMYNFAIEYKVIGSEFRRLGHPKKGKQVTQNSFHRDLICLIKSQKRLFE